MDVQYWWHLLLLQIKETTATEWLAVAFGVAEVLYAKANKIWLYTTGIASTVISMYVLVAAGLYAEGFLNRYYLVMSIYGWWHWVKKKDARSRNIILYAKEMDDNGDNCCGIFCYFIFMLKKLYSFGSTAMGCLGKCHRMGRYVAACKAQNRELDITEYF